MTILSIPSIEGINILRADSYKDGKLTETTSTVYFQREQNMAVSLEGDAHILLMESPGYGGGYSYGRRKPLCVTFVFYNDNHPTILRSLTRKLKKAGGKNIMWARDTIGLLDVPVKGDDQEIRSIMSRWGDQVLASPVVWMPLSDSFEGGLREIEDLYKIVAAFRLVGFAREGRSASVMWKEFTPFTDAIPIYASGASMSLLNSVRRASSDLQEVIPNNEAVHVTNPGQAISDIFEAGNGLLVLSAETNLKDYRKILVQTMDALDNWPYERSWNRLQKEAEVLGLEVDWKCRKKQSRIDKKRVEAARDINFRDFYARTKPLVTIARALVKNALREDSSCEVHSLVEEGLLPGLVMHCNEVMPSERISDWESRRSVGYLERLADKTVLEKVGARLEDSKRREFWRSLRSTLEKPSVAEHTGTSASFWLRVLSTDEVIKGLDSFEDPGLPPECWRTFRRILRTFWNDATIKGGRDVLKTFDLKQWQKISAILNE